jgi:hypothetical protein
MIDVSVTARKVVEKAHAAKFATSFESVTGPAGFEKTRREPPMLSDRQRRTLDQFAALVPKARRSAFHSTVLARLSGSPGDAAVYTACVNASDGLIDSKVLAEHGLVPHKDSGAAWHSKAIMGTGR